MNWHELFLNLNESEKVFLDTMRNHIVSKIITCNYKEAALITPERKDVG